MNRTIYGLFIAALLITGLVFANDYYNHSGVPSTGSPGSSANMRAEFASIVAGFAKLPSVTGNANKAVVVDGGGTALTVTTGSLALGGNLTTSGTSAITLTSTGTTNVTLPTSGTLDTTASVTNYNRITGMAYDRSSGDITNDIIIQPGGAQDSLSNNRMNYGGGTKQADVAWAVGTNAGGLDTGAVGNNDYFIWLIGRADTGVIDILFSLSATAPTMPTNYTQKRLIGWFRRTAAATVPFIVKETAGGGITYRWITPLLSVNLANTLTTAQRTDNLDVPDSIRVDAHITAIMSDATVAMAILQGTDITDAAPSTTASPGFNLSNQVAAGFDSSDLTITVNARALAARGSVATVDAYRVVTKGFTWSRR